MYPVCSANTSVSLLNSYLYLPSLHFNIILTKFSSSNEVLKNACNRACCKSYKYIKSHKNDNNDNNEEYTGLDAQCKLHAPRIQSSQLVQSRKLSRHTQLILDHLMRQCASSAKLTCSHFARERNRSVARTQAVGFPPKSSMCHLKIRGKVMVRRSCCTRTVASSIRVQYSCRRELNVEGSNTMISGRQHTLPVFSARL